MWRRGTEAGGRGVCGCLVRPKVPGDPGAGSAAGCIRPFACPRPWPGTHGAGSRLAGGRMLGGLAPGPLARACSCRLLGGRGGGRPGQAADLVVAHSVEHQGEQLADGGDLGDVAGFLAAAGNDGVLALAIGLPAGVRWIASVSAQRSIRGPCLVTCPPRASLVSDSRWRGVSPAHEHSCPALRDLMMSPISATMTAAWKTGTPSAAADWYMPGAPSPAGWRPISAPWPSNCTARNGSLAESVSASAEASASRVRSTSTKAALHGSVCLTKSEPEQAMCGRVPASWIAVGYSLVTCRVRGPQWGCPRSASLVRVRAWLFWLLTPQRQYSQRLRACPDVGGGHLRRFRAAG